MFEIRTHPIFPDLWEVRGDDGYGAQRVLFVGTLWQCIHWETLMRGEVPA